MQTSLPVPPSPQPQMDRSPAATCRKWAAIGQRAYAARRSRNRRTRSVSVGSSTLGRRDSADVGNSATSTTVITLSGGFGAGPCLGPGSSGNPELNFIGDAPKQRKSKYSNGKIVPRTDVEALPFRPSVDQFFRFFSLTCGHVAGTRQRSKRKFWATLELRHRE